MAHATLESQTFQKPTEEQIEGGKQQRHSRVVCFEIPVADMERAVKFYETVFSIQLNLVQFGPERIAVFPYEAPAISGCLIEAPDLKPGHGALPCLNASSRRGAGEGRAGRWQDRSSPHCDAAGHGVFCAHRGYGRESGGFACDAVNL